MGVAGGRVTTNVSVVDATSTSGLGSVGGFTLDTVTEEGVEGKEMEVEDESTVKVLESGDGLTLDPATEEDVGGKEGGVEDVSSAKVNSEEMLPGETLLYERNQVTSP